MNKILRSKEIISILFVKLNGFLRENFSFSSFTPSLSHSFSGSSIWKGVKWKLKNNFFIFFTSIIHNIEIFLHFITDCSTCSWWLLFGNKKKIEMKTNLTITKFNIYSFSCLQVVISTVKLSFNYYQSFLKFFCFLPISVFFFFAFVAAFIFFSLYFFVHRQYSI